MPYVVDSTEMSSSGSEQVSTSATMPRAAKVGFKKSRHGCQRCKTRRVKCDEQKPTCGNCSRHSAQCLYLEVTARPSPFVNEAGKTTHPRRRARFRSSTRRKSSTPSSDLFPRNLAGADEPEIPETRARRLMELRLIQNNLLNMLTGPPNVSRMGSEFLQLWEDIVPKFTLEHDNVLYAVLTLSATHLLRKNYEDEDLYSARQTYFVMALREQRQACQDITGQNADAVCLCSIMILRTSFAMMQERSLKPYSPPLEWLKMGRGAGAVMWKANAAVPADASSLCHALLDAYMHVVTEQTLQGNLDHPFSRVWTVARETNLREDDREAYLKSLTVINCMQRAIDRNEPAFAVGHKLQAFPMIVPTRFVDMCEEGDEHALVILAHYFGIAAQIDHDFWWLRGGRSDDDGHRESRTALREISAINGRVGDVGRALMFWPMMKGEL